MKGLRALLVTSMTVLTANTCANADVFEYQANGEILRHVTERTERAVERGIERRSLNPAHRKYIPDIAAAAIKNQVPPELVLAVIQQESNWDEEAFSGEAHGLMQLTPGTAERFGLSIGDIYSPIRNIEVGTKYLGWLIRRYDGNLLKAVAAYNAGEGAVDRYGGVPPYPETQAFVDRVTAFYGQPLTRKQTSASLNIDLSPESTNTNPSGVFIYNPATEDAASNEPVPDDFFNENPQETAQNANG